MNDYDCQRADDIEEREELLRRIRSTLDDGHPNPEGYCEWLEGQTTEKLREILGSCAPNH